MNRRKGFTLIELVIVVAIIGILALMIAPKAGETIRETKEKAFLASCDAVIKSIACYQSSNAGRLPEKHEEIDEFMSGTWETMVGKDPEHTEFLWWEPGSSSPLPANPKPLFEAKYYEKGIDSGEVTHHIQYPSM